MNKQDMREWVAELESRIDKSLKKWKKLSRIENGRVVQLQWQFELAHIIMDVYWHDNDEHIELECKCARLNWNHEFEGLTDKTMDRVMDRIGNFAQIIFGKYDR